MGISVELFSENFSRPYPVRSFGQSSFSLSNRSLRLFLYEDLLRQTDRKLRKQAAYISCKRCDSIVTQFNDMYTKSM